MTDSVLSSMAAGLDNTGHTGALDARQQKTGRLRDAHVRRAHAHGRLEDAHAAGTTSVAGRLHL